jgi:hypothetical protein
MSNELCKFKQFLIINSNLFASILSISFQVEQK